jgi:outer membrane cobalamin receptor
LVFSWSLAAGYSPFRNEYEEGPLYIKVNAGTAYKNPSFQDLFWPSGALASGNPDLLPETSLNIDAGLAVEIPAFNEGISDGGVSLKTEAVGFFSTVDNLIQWIPTSGGIWRPLNVGYVYNAGLELSAAASYAEESGKYSIEASLVYNWLKSIDADNTSVNYGRQLAYKPEHSANLSLLFRIPDILSVELNGNYLGYRFSNNANTKYIDQALLLSAAVNYTVTEIFDVSASTDNILNLKYIDRLGYPVPGIEWSLQGRIKI